MRFITLGVVVLLACLQIGAQEAKTADDKSHDVINLENAWNHAEAAPTYFSTRTMTEGLWTGGSGS
jgi:hypothetical protein